MTTLSLHTFIRNAAAVFSGVYGDVTRRAKQAGCTRQTVYEHARQVERRFETDATPVANPPPVTPPPAVLDEATRRRFAVTAFAMGNSTRQIEDLLQILAPQDGPDHSTIGRWILDEARKARAVLKPLDTACVPRIQALALDEVFFGGDRRWWPSSRPA